MIALISHVMVLRQVTMDMNARQLRLLQLSSETTDGVTIRHAAASMTHGDVRVSKPAMSRAANTLEALGLVKRFKDPTDRRSVFVKITASGRKLLRDVDRDIEKGRAAVAKRLATEAAAVPAAA